VYVSVQAYTLYSRFSRRYFSKSVDFLGLGFVIQGAVFAIASRICYNLVMQMNQEVKPFDPFTTLGIDEGSNSTVVKSAYRKMSLKYHPDKSSAPDAAEVFANIAAAYKTLTDDVAFRNWQDHGHPDGPRGMSLEMALPPWILNLSKDTMAGQGFILAYLVLIPIGFWALFRYARGPVGPQRRTLSPRDEQILKMSLHACTDAENPPLELIHSLLVLDMVRKEFKDNRVKAETMARQTGAGREEVKEGLVQLRRRLRDIEGVNSLGSSEGSPDGPPELLQDMLALIYVWLYTDKLNVKAEAMPDSLKWLHLQIKGRVESLLNECMKIVISQRTGATLPVVCDASAMLKCQCPDPNDHRAVALVKKRFKQIAAPGQTYPQVDLKVSIAVIDEQESLARNRLGPDAMSKAQAEGKTGNEPMLDLLAAMQQMSDLVLL